MSYDAILKTYAAATPTVVHLDLTGAYVSFKFTLDVRHICCGATLELLADDDDDFALAEGEVVRAFYATADVTGGNGAIWAGTVTRRERDIAGDTHSYELAGLWHGLDGVLVTTAQTWSSTSVGAIVAELFDDYIGGIVPLIEDSATGIVATGVVDSFSVKIGDEVGSVIDTLAMLAPTAGEAWGWGVDGGGNFNFAEVSDDSGDLQVDAQVRTNVLAARETHSKEKRQVLTVVGDFNGDVGGRVKKTFTTGDAKGKRLIVQVPGIRTWAGMNRFATNWLARNADPTEQVTGLNHLMIVDGTTPPQPQLGQARYRDTTASYDITDYIKTIEVDFGSWFEYSIQLGQSGNGDDPAEAADRYSPAALESFMGGGDYAALDALPEGDDVTDFPSDYPRGWNETELRSVAADEAGGAGGSGVGRGYLVNIWASAPVSGGAMQVFAEIENGGTPFGAGEVTFYAQQVDSDMTTHGTLSQGGTKVSTHGSVELWKTSSGFGPFTGEGMVRFTVSETNSTVTPNVEIYPIADVVGTPADWANCPAKRLADDATESLATASTIIAGWLGSVS